MKIRATAIITLTIMGMLGVSGQAHAIAASKTCEYKTFVCGSSLPGTPEITCKYFACGYPRYGVPLTPVPWQFG